MEKKETYTRSEVETLLQQMHEENIQVIRDHFQAERDKQLPPVWLGVCILAGLIGGLWILALLA